jgi:hypothetical protein
MKPTVPIALLLATAALAGDILEGECSSCGYRVDEVFYGRGFYPYYLTLLYVSPELGAVFEVDFDYVRRLAEHLGVEPPSGDIFEGETLVEAHRDAYDELMTGWSPPVNLLDLLGGDGRLPGWVIVYYELDYDRLPGEITPLDPYAGPHTCPVCGEETLEFHAVGFWD